MQLLFLQDIQRLTYLSSLSPGASPLPFLSPVNYGDVALVANAPNLGNLLMYDYYNQVILSVPPSP